jgi:hypothetical protein
MAVYCWIGVTCLVVALIGRMFRWLGGTTTYSLALLGGIVVFQAGLFLVIRGLMRRAARQKRDAERRRRGDTGTGTTPIAAPPPPTLTAPAAWENWWFQQTRPARKAIKIALFLVIIAGLVMFVSYSETGSVVTGENRTMMTIGVPDHWLVMRMEGNRFWREIRPLTWSFISGMIGFAALGAGICIESAEKRRRRAEAAGAAMRAV